MIIENVSVKSDRGYVYCRSCFYTAHDNPSYDVSYSFSVGINKLINEIDSGVWAVSYLLSMYKYRPKDFILFEPVEITVNNSVISLNDISEYTCYMDELYPLFSSKRSVRKLVLGGLKRNNLNYTPDDIRDLFHIYPTRFDRPLTGVGNEIFRCMAAIGYCHGKQIFCFPWLSQKRFEYYHGHMTDLLDILDKLKKIVILPVGKP